MLDASGLRITEFLASNDNTLDDFEGDSSDWLEIFNPSTSTVSLDGLHLTDDIEELDQWQFPTGLSINPGDFLVVFASNKDLVAPNGELHTNFAISAGGEYLALVAADGSTVIDEFAPEFPDQFEDVSYGLAMSSEVETLLVEGADARAWVPTSGVHDATWASPGFNDNLFNIQGDTGFGYENSPGGNPSYVGQYNTTVGSGTTSLYVRVPFEVDSLNGISQLTLRMKYDDGFVAYLNGVEIASANAPANPSWNSTATTFHDDFDAIQFQEFDVTAALSALVDGENVLAVHGLNFSQGSSDFLIVPELVGGRSVVTTPESLGYFEEPTPGSENGESFAGFASEPEFSVPHGFYTAPQQVAITSETPGALIVYTTDGSAPTVNGALTPTNGTAYSGPITVTGTTTLRAAVFKQDFEPSFVQASTYLFLDDIVDQSPSGQAPAGWPGFNVNGQHLDYGIDPEIVSLYGEQAVKDSLAALPAISLTTDIENLFDSSTGIYVNALNRGRQWERATSVELINPDQSEGFATNAGLRIRGGYGRNDFNPKHAFRLYFRGDYGDGMLDFPLFGDEGTDEFDVLDLRTASNYSWAAWGDSVNGAENTYLREVFARDTQADMQQPYTRSRYYHLYLNGQYWGIYQTQERVQEHFGESYFGGEKEDYDVVKADSTEAYTTEISDGNDIAWRQLFDLAQALANNPTSAADNYWTMQGLNPDGTRDPNAEVLLDVDNLIDYMMIIIYTGGHDTGISAFLGNDRANNWFGIRNREDGEQGFQFFLHDNEHSLGTGELTRSLHGTFAIDRTGPFNTPLDNDYPFFNPVYLHQDLLTHPEYRQQFIDRVQQLMFGDGVLTPDANIARMSERASEVEAAIIAESARWGDAKRSTPYNKGDWDNEVAWLLDFYFPNRHALVIDQLQSDGLYVQAPSFSIPEGETPYGSILTLQQTVPRSTIYYTTDGTTDPRLAGADVNPSPEVMAGSGPIQLTQDTTVLARTRASDGTWSGLVRATYSVTSLTGDYNSDGVVDTDDYTVWRSTFGSTTDLRADGNNDLVVDLADFTLWRDNLGYFLSIASPAAASPTTTTGVSTELSVLGAGSVGEQNLTYTWAVNGPGGVTFSSNESNSAKDTTAVFTEAGDYLFTVTVFDPANNVAQSSSVQVAVEQVVAGVAITSAEMFVAADTTMQLSAFEVDQFGDLMEEATGANWSIVSGSGTLNQSGLYLAPAAEGSTLVRVESTAGVDQQTLSVVTPLAWYKADETFGATLNDSAPGGADGVLSGSTGWASGVHGNALSLSGGRVQLPNGIVNGLQEITISTWFNLDSIGTWSRIFDFGSGTTSYMFLTPEAAFSGGPLRFGITVAGGGAPEQLIDGPTLTTGAWRHVAVTLTGSTGVMYVDGLPVAVNDSMTLSPADLGFTTQNYLGDAQYPADPPLFGRIDDFRIYSQALPPEQILSIAQAPSAPLTVSVSAPSSFSEPSAFSESTIGGNEEALSSAFALYAGETKGDDGESSTPIDRSAPTATMRDNALLLYHIEESLKDRLGDDEVEPPTSLTEDLPEDDEMDPKLVRTLL